MKGTISEGLTTLQRVRCHLKKSERLVAAVLWVTGKFEKHTWILPSSCIENLQSKNQREKSLSWYTKLLVYKKKCFKNLSMLKDVFKLWM